MIDASKQPSANVDYVRIDFYPGNVGIHADVNKLPQTDNQSRTTRGRVAISATALRIQIAF